MTATMSSFVELSLPTKPSKAVVGNSSPSTQSSPTGSLQVVRLHAQPKRPASPDKFTSIGDRLKSSAANPRREKALAAARVELAKDIQQVDGASIKSRRLELGYSQTKLAELLGTSQSHVARIERGKENLYIQTCRRLSEVLQVDMNTLDILLQTQERVAEQRGN